MGSRGSCVGCRGASELVTLTMNACHFSGRSAAKDLGVTQMYVARRVSGDVELSVSDLVMFSNYLGLDPSVLLHAEGSPAPNLRPTD